MLADIVKAEQIDNRYDPSINMKLITFGDPIIDFYFNEQDDRFNIGAFSNGTTSYFPESSEFVEADDLWDNYEKIGTDVDPREFYSLHDLIFEEDGSRFFNSLGIALRYAGFKSTYEEVKKSGGGKAEFKKVLSERKLKISKLHEESIVYDIVNLNPETLADPSYSIVSVRAFLRSIANLPEDTPGFAYSTLATMSHYQIIENPALSRIGLEVMACIISEVKVNLENYPIVPLTRSDLERPSSDVEILSWLPKLPENQISELAASCFKVVYPQAMPNQQHLQ